MKKITIAIDGFSSCGKSTMAKDLAREIGYVYADSGALYRAVTLYAMENNLFMESGVINEEALRCRLNDIKPDFRLNEQTRLPETYLNGANVEGAIRGMEVSSKVSLVSTLEFVREAVTALLQKKGEEKGIVMDGRDIGTTVFPHAELKIFVTASAEIRAKRRYDELKAKGQEVSFDAILQNVKERDYVDQHREVSPLRRAEDALLLDNSEMTIAEQKVWLMERYRQAVQL